MNLIEFIGFIITFLAFIYLMFRRVLEDISRKNRPQDSMQRHQKRISQEEQLKEFLKSLEIDMEESDDYGEEEALPPPPPARLKTKPLPSPPTAFKYMPLEKEKFEIEKNQFHQPDIVSKQYLKQDKLDPYKIKAQDEIETLKVLAKKPQQQKLVIYKEILDRPKSLQ